jgi:hypothetical protein
LCIEDDISELTEILNDNMSFIVLVEEDLIGISDKHSGVLEELFN